MNPGICTTGPAGATSPPERPQRHLTSVTFGQGTFVAVGYGLSILSSRDGTNWVNQSASIANPIIGVNYKWETYTYGGDAITLISDVPEDVERNTPFWLTAVTHGKGTFVAVGNAGTILTSKDGAQWRLNVWSNSVLLKAVACDSLHFVTVGGDGTILRSLDGEHWRYEDSRTLVTLNDVVAAENGFIAVGEAGTILRSQGNRWTRIGIGSTEPLTCVVNSNGL